MNKHVCFWALSLVLTFGFNVQAEEDAKNIELCTQQLVEIGKAIQAYQKEEGNIPAWLSDLHPKYLKDEKLLLCPADETSGTPGYPAGKDPKLPVSYLYEFNPSMKEWKTRQLGSYGDIVPTSYFIDKSGVVRYRDVGFGPGMESKLEAHITELLGEQVAGK